MDPLARGSWKSVSGEHYGTPKELWAFRTAPTAEKPSKVARAFLVANAELLGVRDVLATLRHQRTVVSLVPDFGQSKEAAAIGEGFGDYLAASFFAENKPEKYRTS